MSQLNQRTSMSTNNGMKRAISEISESVFWLLDKIENIYFKHQISYHIEKEYVHRTLMGLVAPFEINYNSNVISMEDLLSPIESQVINTQERRYWKQKKIKKNPIQKVKKNVSSYKGQREYNQSQQSVNEEFKLKEESEDKKRPSQDHEQQDQSPKEEDKAIIDNGQKKIIIYKGITNEINESRWMKGKRNLKCYINGNGHSFKNHSRFKDAYFNDLNKSKEVSKVVVVQTQEAESKEKTIQSQRKRNKESTLKNYLNLMRYETTRLEPPEK